MAPVSDTCFSPFSSMMASASLPESSIASSTSLAILPEMVLSAMRSSRPASACGDTGESAMSSPRSLSRPKSSLAIQLAQRFGSAGWAAASASYQAASSRVCVSTSAS